MRQSDPWVRPTAQKPYNLEENGILERMNRIFMNAVRCTLSAAHLPESYRNYVAQDLIFKQKYASPQHHGQNPIQKWNNTTITLLHVPIFIQIGYIPISNTKTKLYDKGQPAKYLGMIELTHIFIQTMNGHDHGVCLSDFHPIQAHKYPTRINAAAFTTFHTKMRPISTHIPPGTLPSPLCRH